MLQNLMNASLPIIIALLLLWKAFQTDSRAPFCRAGWIAGFAVFGTAAVYAFYNKPIPGVGKALGIAVFAGLFVIAYFRGEQGLNFWPLRPKRSPTE